MRVLLVNYEYPPIGAGAATATLNLGRALAKLGHDVTVLTSRYGNLSGWSEEDPVHVYRCRAARRRPDRASILEMISFIAGAMLALPSVVKFRKPEAAIAFFSIPSGPIAFWARVRYGLPYVVSLRGGDVPGSEPGLATIYRILTPIRRKILRCATAVVANSEGLRRMSEGADPVPVDVIPNGVDTSLFSPAAAPVPADGPLRILFVGRLQTQKNVGLLLERLAAVVSVRGRDAFTLTIVGDGPLRSELESLSGRLGLDRLVAFRGWLDRRNLLAEYRSATCVVNPSLYEGLPNVVLEAMSCGVPVIASRVPGNESVVRDGETGFLFDLDKPEGLDRLLLRMADDRSLIAALGKRGREIVEAEYGWPAVAASYAALLQQGARGAQ